MKRLLLALPLALTFTLTPFAQTQPAPSESAAADEAALARQQERDFLSAELRALEAESKELLKPVDAAATRAEIAAAAWPLDAEWARRLLREAFELTLPEKVDRAKLRAQAVGAPSLGTPEDRARAIVRSRVLKLAARDPALAAELSAAAGRELGVVQEGESYALLAGDAAGAGRLGEAADYVRRAIEVEPTLFGIGSAVNSIGARDRAAADRLILEYIEHLRRLPLSVFSEPNRMAPLLPIALSAMLRPAEFQFFIAAQAPPAGREAVRAYINFIFDTTARIEQAGGDIKRMHLFITLLWPHLAEHAPELSGQFVALERATRRPGQKPPSFNTFASMKEADEKRYEERIKTARQTKDQLDLEVAVTAASGHDDFEEARRLLSMMKDSPLKSQLAEQVDLKESLALTKRGELAPAEKLARKLTNPSHVLQAFPPLIRAHARAKNNAAATYLTTVAVRQLREIEEGKSAQADYTPTLLAPVAASIRVFKQPRTLWAMSELALAVAPADEQAALDTLDALVETAARARIESENGSPSFNLEVFNKLAAANAPRARAAASRFGDRLQRISAAAAVIRARTDAISKEPEARP